MMHLKMYLKKRFFTFYIYIFFSPLWITFLLYWFGEQMTIAHQEQERGIAFKQTAQRHRRVT